MSAEIDWQILRGLYKDVGWFELTFDPNRDAEEAASIKEWIAENCKGHVQSRGSCWLFENEQDLIWFTLRWS